MEKSVNEYYNNSEFEDITVINVNKESTDTSLKYISNIRC